jgi:O-antigen ligase
MTTSITNADTSILRTEVSEPALPVKPRVPVGHSIASRFLFLQICITLVLSALAYGTVHYWALAAFSLSAVLVIFLWIVDGWRLGSLRISKNVLQLPLLGLVALGLFQLLPLRTAERTGELSAAAVRSLSLDPFSTRLVVVQLTTLLIFFAATLVFVDTPHRLRIIVRTIAIFGFLLAIFGMTQSFTSPTKIYWVRELTQSTAFGPFINRHHFAGYMELTLAIPLGLLFTGAVDGEKRLLYIFAVGMMAIALILTNSRGGIISLAVEVIFLGVIAGFGKQSQNKETTVKQNRVRISLVRAALALALVIGILGGTLFFGGEESLSRFVGSVNTEDPTTGRAHFWSVTLDIIRAHPFVGTGLGAFGVVYTGYDSNNGLYRLEQAHNDYLQILSDGGVVGAALGLFFIVMLFRMGFERRETRDNFRRGVATGALAGCFAVLVHSFFDFTLHTTSNALLFLVLAALATVNGRVEHVEQRHRRRRRRRHKQPYLDSPAISSGPLDQELSTEYEAPGTKYRAPARLDLSTSGSLPDS